jgi:hypothetical protein
VLRRFDLLDLVHQDLKVSEQSEHVILEWLVLELVDLLMDAEVELGEFRLWK